MASLGGTFRPEDAPEGGDFEPVPAGEYLAQIVESDVGPTKDGQGTILKLVYEIVSGPCSQRRIWERLNISNPNAQTQGIAQRALAAIVESVGLSSVSDSEELHYKPLRIRVIVKDDGKGYGPQNRITKYMPASGAAPEKPAASEAATPRPAAAAAPAKPAAGARPWGQRATA